MPVVRNIFTDGAGVPLRNEWVMVTLIAQAGFSADGTSRPVRIHSDVTDAAGLWTSTDLPPQSSYAETGTYYRVECAGVVEYFDVPNSGGPYWLSARRRNPVPISGDWKVLPKLSELPDATQLAGAAQGSIVAYNATAQRWESAFRVESWQLTNAVNPKADKIYVDNADQALSNRISPLETWRPAVDGSLAAKASIATVNTLADRTTVAEDDIDLITARVATLEGGGSGTTPATSHTGLRNLVTTELGGIADDHPQYLNEARGDARYHTKAIADSRYAGLNHAGRHATNGPDPITPASIGAANAAHSLLLHNDAIDTGDGNKPITRVFAQASVRNTAADPTTNYGIAMKLMNRSTGTDSHLRSLRQPVVHEYNSYFAVTPVLNSLRTLMEFTFRPRERCHLSIRYQVVGYINAPGFLHPGYMSTARITQQLFAVGGAGTKLWEEFAISEIVGVIGNANYRPAAYSYWDTVCTEEVEPNVPLRYVLSADSHASAPSPIQLFFARVVITETAVVVL